MGVFDLQFDMLKTSPRQVALSFCEGKKEELNIASEELLLNGCVPNVERFIIDDLTARGVIEQPETPKAATETAASPQVEEPAAHSEPVASVHNAPHIPFTPEEEAALKVAEEEIVAHHDHHHEPVASLETEAVPPADVSAPVDQTQAI